jgi:hypothetical protein
LSLVTRMIGFGLCLVGASVVGFAESLHSTAGLADGWIIKYVSVQGVAPNATYMDSVLAETNNYIQQNVTMVWTNYVAIGVVLAIAGAILVAVGDRKPRDAKKRSQKR